MILHARDLDFGTGQIEIRRDDKQPLATRGNDLVDDRRLAEQWLVKTGSVQPLQTKRASGVCLRIKIDDQDTAANLRERPTEVHGRGRFADPAFLVSDCYYQVFKK